jgi:hypothetical protein
VTVIPDPPRLIETRRRSRIQTQQKTGSRKQEHWGDTSEGRGFDEGEGGTCALVAVD